MPKETQKQRFLNFFSWRNKKRNNNAAATAVANAAEAVKEYRMRKDSEYSRKSFKADIKIIGSEKNSTLLSDNAKNSPIKNDLKNSTPIITNNNKKSSLFKQFIKPENKKQKNKISISSSNSTTTCSDSAIACSSSSSRSPVNIDKEKNKKFKFYHKFSQSKEKLNQFTNNLSINKSVQLNENIKNKNNNNSNVMLKNNKNLNIYALKKVNTDNILEINKKNKKQISNDTDEIVNLSKIALNSIDTQNNTKIVRTASSALLFNKSKKNYNQN